MNKVEAMAILGIGDARDARSAMRVLVKIHHPDLRGGDGEQFKKVHDAYRLLTNVTYRMGNVERLSFGNAYVENVFQPKIIKGLRQDGAICWQIVGNVFQKLGLPDLYVASKIWTGWLELKVENRVLEPHQAKRIRELNERGVPAFVARYRRKHGVFIEIVDGDSATPIELVEDWKQGLLCVLARLYQQVV